MSTPLRVLLVEDSEDDAVLLLRELRKGGYEPLAQRVETAEAMNGMLDAESWDIIISDYSLPKFGGPAALKLMQERNLDLPFMVVSGKIGEETAVALMKAGAHDYLMKGHLARLSAAVERELREAAARREQRQTERLKNELLDVLAHELRTPISVLLVGFEQLAEERAAPPEPGQHLTLTIIGENLKRLNHLSEKALLTTKLLMNKGKLTLAETDITELVQSIGVSFKNFAQSRGIQLAVTESSRPIICFGDERWLKEALNQIVENAVQATSYGGQVTLSCAATPEGVEIRAQDTGRGISAEELPTLFERFRWVGDINERKTGGLGLGLFIAKSAVNACGGTLTVESVPGRGTCMIVRLKKDTNTNAFWGVR